MTSTKSQTAFSLIEVTLALGILAFGIVAIFAMLPVGLTMSRESTDETAAVNILSSFAADIRNSSGKTNESFTQGVPLTGAGQGTAYFDENGTRVAGRNAAIYAVNWKVRASNPTHGIPAQVHIMVSWPPAKPQPDGWVETTVILENAVTAN